MNTCPNCCVPGGVTVMAEVPLCPPLVAVIVADPAATPATSPPPLTVAADVLPLCQVTVRPTSGLPFASLGVALSWTLLPAETDVDAGVTVTDATGMCTTVMAELPLFPSLVAVIVADPATTPVTSPVPFTPAADGLLFDHVIDRPTSVLPSASFSVAVSCSVWPSFTVADAGVSVTVATGAGGWLPVIAKLQTVCVPVIAVSAQLASAVTVLCSVRNANPVPIVCSAPPAGVTYAEYVWLETSTTTRKW